MHNKQIRKHQKVWRNNKPKEKKLNTSKIHLVVLHKSRHENIGLNINNYTKYKIYPLYYASLLIGVAELDIYWMDIIYVMQFID